MSVSSVWVRATKYHTKAHAPINPRARWAKGRVVITARNCDLASAGGRKANAIRLLITSTCYTDMVCPMIFMHAAMAESSNEAISIQAAPRTFGGRLDQRLISAWRVGCMAGE